MTSPRPRAAVHSETLLLIASLLALLGNLSVPSKWFRSIDSPVDLAVFVASTALVMAMTRAGARWARWILTGWITGSTLLACAGLVIFISAGHSLEFDAFTTLAGLACIGTWAAGLFLAWKPETSTWMRLR